ncbi:MULTISPECIES: HprK-related kinase B [unclassified Halomonas]|uniref:HprK-related kinase B n=1 Tax=unclassified Halomonas TaxID=2609666 RepID=UPI00069844E2|nr:MULTISPECIES: HprK-related kinase B [unclassified Halomonas]RAH36865.1 HprK-related kinase B [Halomonas sp. SL1]
MSTANATPAALAETLIGEAELLERALVLDMGRATLAIRSNSAALLDRLGDYFAHCLAPQASATLEVIAIEREAPVLDTAFVDWAREPGKTGRKDSVHDLPGGRLVRKVRTGMVFLQSAPHCIAAGPCLAHDNQVVNFVIAQYMNHLQRADWQVCHAAALVRDGRALAIAAFSGGGKSTAMLHALEHPATVFLTNDRLFLKREGGEVRAAGVPKQPRINPGTALHNPRLETLIPAARRDQLRALPADALWELEEKHDVPVAALYGPDRLTDEATLGGFVVLNWRRDDASSPRVAAVDLTQRRDLLAAIMKSAGPFYQRADGSFLADDEPLDEAAYLDVLAGVPVFEVSGGIDFNALVAGHLIPLLEG